MGMGGLLRQRREDLKLTITAAANLAEVPRSYLSMIESGKRSPKPKVLMRLAHALGIASDAWVSALLEEKRRSLRLVEVGMALFDAADYTAAERVLAGALSISRQEPEGRYNRDIYHLLGKVYFAQGHYTQALHWFELLERATRHATDLRMQGVASYNIGLTLGANHQRPESVDKLNEAIGAFQQLGLRAELASAWLAKANQLLAMHLYPQAAVAYRRASHLLRGTPLQGNALLGSAIATLALRGPAAAMPALQTLAQNPAAGVVNRAQAEGYIGVVMRWLGDYDDALVQFERVLAVRDQLPPDLVAGIIAEIVLCNALKGDFGTARRMYREYRSLDDEKDSSDIAVMNILAFVLGLDPPESPLPAIVEDSHELRLSAALGLLQTPMTYHHK